MDHRCEGRGDLSADLLGGRVVGDDGGVLRLEQFQARVEFVEFGVRDQGCVVVVVGGAVLADLVDELLVFLAHGLCGDQCIGGFDRLGDIEDRRGPGAGTGRV